MAQPFELEFELTEDHIVDLSLHAQRTTHRYLRALPLLAILLGGAYWLISSSAGQPDLPWSFWVIFGVTALLAATTTRSAQRFLIAQRARGGPLGDLGRWRIVADADGLAVTTPKTTAQMRWDVFMRVDRTRGAVLLYRTQLAALLIPNAAFSSDHDRSAFCDYAADRVTGGGAPRSMIRWIVLLWAALILVFYLVHYLNASR